MPILILILITICCFISSILYVDYFCDWNNKFGKREIDSYHARIALLIFFWPIGLFFAFGFAIKTIFQIFSSAELFNIFKRRK